MNKDEDKLIYYCRNCGNEDTSLATNTRNLYVSKSTIKKEMNYKNVINKYTKLDPTLPRINNIDCPNKECSSNNNSGGEQKNNSNKDILYIRYDDKNMKYIYLCSLCDTVWNTNSK